MDEFELQKVRRRIFQRFTQWYYQGEKSNMPMVDTPELVVILQALGFSLHSVGFQASGGVPSSGCRVTVDCSTSGLRAELSSPPEEACRCHVFSKTDSESHEVLNKASFWHVTSSQERLNTGIQGSSLLPELDSTRLSVIREVLQILQEEISIPELTPRKKRHHRHTSTSALLAVNMESPKVEATCSPVTEKAATAPLHLSASQEQLSTSNIEMDTAEVSGERRTSISCCEEMRQQMSSALALENQEFKMPTRQISNSVFSSTTSIDTAVSEVSVFGAIGASGVGQLVRHLDLIMKHGAEAMGLIDPASLPREPRGKSTTFLLPEREDTNPRKKRRVVPTPGPARKMEPVRPRVKPSVPIPVAPAPGTSKFPTHRMDSARRHMLPQIPSRVPPRTLGATGEEGEPAAGRSTPSNTTKPAMVGVFKRLSSVATGRSKRAPPTPDNK